MDFKEKRHVSLDKSKIECYNCYRKGHFARECRSGRSQRRRSYGDNGRSNAPTNESSSQALVAQDGLGGYNWSNDFDVEPVNYALMGNLLFLLIKPSINTARPVSTVRSVSIARLSINTARHGNPEILLQDHAVVDSGCSSHMTGNKAYIQTMKISNGVLLMAFGSDPKESGCLILSPSFKLLVESHVILRAPRKDDVYSLDLKNIVPSGSINFKAFRVYNKRTKRVEENLHINFLEDQPNMARTGPNLMFDLDFLTNSMNYIPVSVENHVNVDADLEDVADKEEQHQMQDNEKDLQDELEMLVTQELVAKAMDDVSRQAFEEEKRRIASQKKAAQATSTNQLSTDRPSVNTDRPFVSTDRSFVSTDRSNTLTVSTASTSTGANANGSSFVYLGGKIPIDASTLPNADLPIDPNMPALEDASDTLPNDGIFNGAYDDDED
ncbi:ribonuclease H-like domain-containing protein [Tanacetum coccineum]